MLDWKKIDNTIFEEIAYDYISSVYPDLDWIPTKASRDGNKDGYAIINNPIGVTLKYWYEAKYTINTHKSIPKAHLDSTLVSCLLDGKVAIIAFITNAYISEDYIRRATIFSKKRDNLRIIYVNGAELEHWFSQNSDMEDKYFHSRLAEAQDLRFEIFDYCLLEKYCLNGETFSKVKNVKINQEYILYIFLYSDIEQKISIVSRCDSIKIMDNGNFYYDDYECLDIHIGYNTLFIPIEARSIPNSEIVFDVTTQQEIFSICLRDVSVIDIYVPTIVYESQSKIETAVCSVMKNPDTSNAAVSIIGNMGSGKSYLMDSLIEDSRNPFSSYMISFYGDDVQDAISCYKIILMSKYGDIWNYSEENDVFSKLNEIELSLYAQITNNIIMGNSVEEITNYYESCKLTKNIDKSIIQIFVDDFHKLSVMNQKLLNSFLGWFVRQNYNCKIFIFSRPESCPAVSTIQFELQNIVPEDVVNTVRANFGNNNPLSSIVKKHTLPLNVLHLIVILTKIKECQDEWKGRTPLEVSVSLNKIYQQSVSATHSTLGQQLLREYKSSILIYVIYKIKTGICIDALHSFWGDDILEEMYIMIQKRIIKEKNDILLPYHDILLTAFGTYNNDELNMELADFVDFAEKQHFITKAKFFSVLLGMGKKYFWKYRKDAEEYRDFLHGTAAYHEALELSQTLEAINTKSLTDYSAKDCWNLFIKANCIKYTDSHCDANKEFKKICNIYEKTQNMDILGTYLEAETEIINDYIWMLELKNALKKMQIIEPILLELYRNSRLEATHAINAFLNFFNRRMFLNYMIDEGKRADYDVALAYSEELVQRNYVAFAKIDYAKCLYVENIAEAEKLLEDALDIISLLDEPRRQLDIESELWFIKCINNCDIDEDIYTSLLKRSNLKHYAHTSTKLRLKHSLLKLLFSGISCMDIREELYTITADNSSVTLGNRNQAFINHLLAASYYKEGNIIESNNFTRKCLRLLSQMGESYTSIHSHNMALTDNNDFILLHTANNSCESDNSDKFIIDTRLW